MRGSRYVDDNVAYEDVVGELNKGVALLEDEVVGRRSTVANMEEEAAKIGGDGGGPGW